MRNLPKACTGCGSLFNTHTPSLAGFIPPQILTPTVSSSLAAITAASTITKAQLNILLKSDKQKDSVPICARCHSLKHNPSSCAPIFPDRAKLLGEIAALKDGLVVHLHDPFAPPISLLPQLVGKRCVLVSTKTDLCAKMPLISSSVRSAYKAHINTSAKTGDGIMQLVDIITQLHTPSSQIHFVGHANVGKSALLNTLLSVSGLATNPFTTSILPGTTVSSMSAQMSSFGDLFKGLQGTLVDTPGLLDTQSLTQYLTYNELKQSLPTRTLKPKGYPALGSGMSCFIGGLARIDYHSPTNTPLTPLAFFGSNKIPLVTTKTSQAPDFYSRNVASNASFMYPPMVPAPARERGKAAFKTDPRTPDEIGRARSARLAGWPELVPVDLYVPAAGRQEVSFSDICLRGIGWVCVGAHPTSDIHLRVWSLAGLGVSIRKGRGVRWDMKNQTFSQI